MTDNEPESLQAYNSLDCWDYSIELECLEGSQDLQLAAELGKTLLERNKELEANVKEKQTIIEDQAQEIEYLTKQTIALREANESRLKIYEQLEVGIQDLERANHNLNIENSTLKKHKKTLTATIETWEAKCEDLQAANDELRLQIDVLKRQLHKASNASPNALAAKENGIEKQTSDKIDEYNTPSNPTTPVSHTKTTTCDKQTDSGKKNVAGESQNAINSNAATEDDDYLEQISQLLAQLRESRSQCCREERRVAELEEQLVTLTQQNQALENQLLKMHHQKGEMSMHEELTTLEEVRQGQMCSKCLRNLNSDESDLPEDDDPSMLGELMASTQRSSFRMEVQAHEGNQSSPISKQSTNPYKDLVEKYEALVEVHRQPARNHCLSLQEELQMSGDFNTLSTKDTDEESGHGDSLQPEKQHKKTRKTFSHTPTDFSEAETSSSGFSDETSNKETQTEGGSFLCSIDGQDCKFSIYDDANPVDSRFRNRPEYQKLFKEIFAVLKKAAETKNEDEKLPQLDDSHKTIPNVPPVTPSNDQLPDFPDDDTQSILSSTMSELSTSQTEATTVIENIIESQNQPIPEPDDCAENKNERILKPLVRQQLDYVSVEVRKRSSSRRKNKYADRSDSPVTHIIGSPKIQFSNRPNSGRRRRDAKNNVAETENAWNGNTLQFWSTSRNVASPTPSQGSGKGIFEFKPSVASQDLHKLKKLDLTYADVLRNADTKKREALRYRRK